MLHNAADTEAAIFELVLFALAGAGYALSGYVKNRHKDPNTKFRPALFARTVVVGALAGALVSAGYAEGFEPAMAIAVPIVDQALNAVKTNQEG